MIKGFSEKRLVLVGLVVRRERIDQSESSSMRYNTSISPLTESLVEVRRFPNLLKLPSSLTHLTFKDRSLAYTSKDYINEINV